MSDKTFCTRVHLLLLLHVIKYSLKHGYRTYEGWNFNSGNYLFTTDTK